MTYQEVKEYIERYDCKLLSTEYKSITDMLEIQCVCGEVFNRSFSNFKRIELDVKSVVENIVLLMKK